MKRKWEILKYFRPGDLIPKQWGSHIDKTQNYHLAKLVVEEMKANQLKELGISKIQFINMLTEIECLVWIIYLSPKLYRIFNREKSKGRVSEATSGDSMPDFLIGNTYYEITKSRGVQYNLKSERNRIIEGNKSSQYNFKNNGKHFDVLNYSISISNNIANSISAKMEKKYKLGSDKFKSIIIWNGRNITYGAHNSGTTLLFLISKYKILIKKFLEDWKEIYILMEDRWNNNNFINPETKKSYSNKSYKRFFGMNLFILNKNLWEELITIVPDEIIYKNNEKRIVEIVDNIYSIFDSWPEKQVYNKSFDDYKQDFLEVHPLPKSFQGVLKVS